MQNSTHDCDFLDGADAIAAFLGTTRRRAFYLLQRKLIPAAKIGDRWTARKSKLIQHHERLESEGEAA
jgi:hypothetical protein